MIISLFKHHFIVFVYFKNIIHSEPKQKKLIKCHFVIQDCIFVFGFDNTFYPIE